MKIGLWHSVLSTIVLAASRTVAPAAPVDATTWQTLDKILGRPGKVPPGDIHKYGWPRSDLHATIGDAIEAGNGRPISAQYEVEDGGLELSVTMESGGRYTEVIA